MADAASGSLLRWVAARAHLEHRLADLVAEWVLAREAKRKDVKEHNDVINGLEEMIEEVSSELVTGQFQQALPFAGDDGPRIFVAVPEADEEADEVPAVTVPGPVVRVPAEVEAELLAAADAADEGAESVNEGAESVNDEQRSAGEPCVACGGSRRDSTGGICRACDGHGVQGGAKGVDPDPLGLSELDPEPEESLPGTVEENGKGGARGELCKCGKFNVPGAPAKVCLVCQGRAIEAEMCAECRTFRHAWGKTSCSTCGGGGGVR